MTRRLRIYIASSWKNEGIVKVLAQQLRREGYEVDAFCDDSTGRYVFHWSEIGDKEELDAINFLANPKSHRAYREDKKWLDWADSLIMVAPCGKSSHLEAGYMKGRGRKVIFFGDFPKGEFEVMYDMADYIFRFREVDRLLQTLHHIDNSVQAGDYSWLEEEDVKSKSR